jgi:hypothetical protein
MESMPLTLTLTVLALRALARVVDLAGPTRLRLRLHVLSARLQRTAHEHRAQPNRVQPSSLVSLALVIRQLAQQLSARKSGQ